MPRPNKLDPHAAYIRQLVDAGFSQRYIAGELGVSQGHLNAWLRRNRDQTPDGLSDAVSQGYTEIPVIHLDYSDHESWRVYPLGDLHIGSHAHARDRWEEWVDYLVRDGRSSLLNTGDNFNSAIVGSKSDVYSEEMTVGASRRLFTEQLRPLAEAGRLDILMPGNHEARIWRAVGDCPVRTAAEVLGVPYSQSAALLVYHVGDVEYEVFVRHGTGTGRTLVALQRSSQVIDADVYVSGHVHSQTVTSDNVFVRAGDRVERKRRIYLSSGSFVNYEPYAAERGYSPGRIGAPRIYLDGRRKDAHVSI
jgi:hypothetical protein